MLIRENVIRIGPATESEDVGVFEKQQLLGSFSRSKTFYGEFLQPKAFIVRNNT
jgi:hypothetical protein